jgi:hypothetical protein
MTFAPVTQHFSRLNNAAFVPRKEEISKEVENNVISRLNEYAKQYVPRRTGAAGGSSVGGGSSGRS